MILNSKHNNSGFSKWLLILDGEDLPTKLFWSKNAELKFSATNEENDDSKKPRSRENIALPSEEETVNGETEDMHKQLHRGSDKVSQSQCERSQRKRPGEAMLIGSPQFSLCSSMKRLVCENIRFFSLFAAGDVSRVPSYEEQGETDVFAGYETTGSKNYTI